ncbi:DUF892 family protein [Brucella intermedia]|nr:DUF892 family protein [Brucella intermedia]
MPVSCLAHRCANTSWREFHGEPGFKCLSDTMRKRTMAKEKPPEDLFRDAHKDISYERRSAQAVGNDEIARCGTLKRWPKERGLNHAQNLLDQTLQEQFRTDCNLMKLAGDSANQRATAA